MTSHPVEGQWLDFYALLEVPVNADEDTIRKRIGKVYSEATVNSDHRDLSRRQYFQALVERVLPQCRRVLLDPEWRAKYDRQHILHSINDPSAQDYVTFISSMRTKDSSAADNEGLPQRVQDDMNAAREVVECALQGTELDLLPSTAVSSKDSPSVAPAVETAPTSLQASIQRSDFQAVQQAAQPAPSPIVSPTPNTVEEIRQEGELVRAKVITAQEAAEIRRRRASNPDGNAFAKPPVTDMVGDGSLIIPNRKGWKPPVSRVVVGETGPQASRSRVISATSMNLMVAIVGVLLTITIQRFAATPAIATNMGRMPVYVAVASEMEAPLLKAETEWEKTPEGANFDLVVQPLDSRSGLRRALGADGQMPDAWIPSDSMWVDLYNAQASKFKRGSISADQSIAQTPMVLIARSERAAELRRRFPNHQISSWEALRSAISTGAGGHLGLTDPQKAATGALARFSMAREWGTSHGLTPLQAAKSPDFWRWMASFEENAPAAPAETGQMVKDLVLGTTGRFWWAIAYESDALEWMSQGKALEIYYLPRTTLADHPFCAIDRVGAPLEVAQARAHFENFLRSPAMQKELLDSGFRPTEVSLKTKTPDNPFLKAALRSHGARTENLPRDERPNAAMMEAVVREWGKRYG